MIAKFRVYNYDMALEPFSLAVSPYRQGKRISMEVIQTLVSYIVTHFNPEMIILFGSYAYGNPRPESDIDLLVVMDTSEGELETSVAIKKSLPPHAFGIDILARSHTVIKKRQAQGDWFLREVVAKGKILYERDHPRVGQSS
jgi:predicted nucleotidyltransferase